MTTDEMLLLRWFDEPNTVHLACKATHNQNMHFAVPQQVIQAEKDGLLRIDDFDGPLKDSKGIYSRMLVLTDSGRDACGLPKATVERPAKAKPKTKGLFE